MDSVKKRHNIKEKIIIISLALVALGLLVLFFSDIIVPFIKLQIAQDMEGAKDLLIQKGIIGYIMVPLIESLQMVVIFISAEFIQITSGMTYPFFVTLLLCDLGVSLGASIIYFLVNVLRFKGDIFLKQNKIEKYEQLAKSKSTIVLMYLLFIMPIIPFGAICYFGSSRKVPYLRYLLTCATGCIPSIVTSILMGTAIREFIKKSLPIWALVLIIVLSAAILFVLLFFVIKKYFFKSDSEFGNEYLSGFVEKVLKVFLSIKAKYVNINNEALEGIDTPIIYIADHHSFYDFGAIINLKRKGKLTFVMNQYLFRMPFIGWILKRVAIIGKKVFYKDTNAVKKIIRAIQKGMSIAIFPEAILSTFGANSYIDPSIAHLCLKLNVNIALIQIRNNYFIKPKWRKKVFKNVCETEVKKVITKEELASYTQESLIKEIRDTLSYNEFTNKGLVFKQKNKAVGLQNILYYCPDCNSFYSNISYGNTLKCTHCNKEYHITENYQFDDDNIHNIYEYYEKIKEFELKNLNSINLDIDVDVKILTDNKKKYRKDVGVFHLDSTKMSYKSKTNDTYIEYEIKDYPGLAYSVNEEFEFYYKSELYYFYPSVENRAICTRVALIYDLLRGPIND